MVFPSLSVVIRNVIRQSFSPCREQETALSFEKSSSSLMVAPASLHLSTQSSRAWPSADKWHSMQLRLELQGSPQVGQRSQVSPEAPGFVQMHLPHTQSPRPLQSTPSSETHWSVLVVQLQYSPVQPLLHTHSPHSQSPLSPQSSPLCLTQEKSSHWQ